MPMLQGLLFIGLLSLYGCGPQPNDPFYEPFIPPEITRAPKGKAGSLFVADYHNSLFADTRAYKIGDLITVRLEEKIESSKETDNNFNKEFKKTNANPLVLGANLGFSLFKKLPFFTSTPNTNDFSNDISSKSEFTGGGGASQKNQLTGNITVTVAHVLPNRNLVIKGEKWVTLTNGSDFLRIQGIVRPGDIQADNTVNSSRIANVRITFKGKGAIADSASESMLARFFVNPWYPL